MITVTRPSDDKREAAPLLRLLRHAIDEELFETRLTRAVADGYRAMVAHLDGVPAAMIGFRISDDVCWGRTFYVDDLVARPELRSSGLGSALIDAAKSEAARQGCDRIRLCSGLDRFDAHRFYERQGFKNTSLQFVYEIEEGTET